MKNKAFSEAVCAACLVLFFAVVFAECATAQTVTVKRQDPGRLLVWNNSDYFKDAPKAGFFNWKSYPETWDGKLFVSWGMFAAGGMMWGAREAYHADPYVFERVYDVGSKSFWGSDAWERNYVDNDPEKSHKHEYLGNVGRDVWHTFGFGSNVLVFSGTFAIGARRQPLKYRAANALIGCGIRSLTASLTYNSLRAR